MVLEEYAKKDSDVAFFLQLWLPWYKKVQQREIRLPCYAYKLSIYFTNPDLSPLAERYNFDNASNNLLEAVCNFGEAMDDSLSDPSYLARLQEAGEPPGLVPDEPPPPEEEVPLPIQTAEPSSLQGLKGWLYRMISGRGCK